MLNYIRNQMEDGYENTPAMGDAIEDTIYEKPNKEVIEMAGNAYDILEDKEKLKENRNWYLKLSEGKIKRRLPCGRDTCRHEAVHAVIGEYFGIKVKEIQIESSSGNIEFEDYNNPSAEGYLEKWICIDVAPNVYLGHIKGADYDIAKVKVELQNAGIDNDEGIKFVQKCQTTVRELLEKPIYREQVDELASQLKMYHMLIGDDVRKVLDGVADGTFTHLDYIGVFARNVEAMLLDNEELLNYTDKLDQELVEMRARWKGWVYRTVPEKIRPEVRRIVERKRPETAEPGALA